MLTARHLIIGLLLVAAVGMAVQVADSQDQPTQSLHQRMESINRTLRGLRRSVNSADQNAATLSAVADMQAQFTACKGMVPDQVEKEQDADKKKALATTFRVQICKALRNLLDIEIAVLEGRNADAAKLVAEMKDLEHDSHKKLGVDD